MEDNYSKAYKEVIEIFKYVPQESIDKIPKDMLEMFRDKMDKKYFFKIDINKKFEEQKLLEETKSILANIFRDYWATPYQRKQIIAKENYDRKKNEKEKEEKYNSDDIFINKSNKIQKNGIENTSNLLVEVKKEKFYEKLIKFIKKLFQFN